MKAIQGGFGTRSFRARTLGETISGISVGKIPSDFGGLPVFGLFGVWSGFVDHPARFGGECSA
ncbi:hypothetical protein, partial [Amycolatopsis thailandensis]|uniref:hypothetical protein n=1 Tax=Amycolatopsis thailandensis TaxID=589330 RepID=UPI00363EA21A